MPARSSLLVALFLVLAALWLMPLHARELKPAATAGTVPQPATAGQATKGSSSGTSPGRAQREAGWLSNFMPSFNMPSSFSMPSFDLTSFGALPLDKKTTEARSSLTGIPQVMSFEQQLSGGLPVDSSSATVDQTAPAPAQPAAATTAAPASTPAPQKQPAAQQQGAAASPADSSACSPDDRSADAVHRCVNAMRTNPHAWTSAYKCDWQQWISSYGAPRPALKQDNRLARSSAKLAEDMAATRTVSHVGADGSSMAQRIQEESFTTYPQAENVAGGQGSALEVAADWMCSQGHRDNIMSCSLDSVGTSTAYDVNGRAYYAQDFGCSVSNKCGC